MVIVVWILQSCLINVDPVKMDTLLYGRNFWRPVSHHTILLRAIANSTYTCNLYGSFFLCMWCMFLCMFLCMFIVVHNNKAKIPTSPQWVPIAYCRFLFIGQLQTNSGHATALLGCTSAFLVTSRHWNVREISNVSFFIRCLLNNYFELKKKKKSK